MASAKGKGIAALFIAVTIVMTLFAPVTGIVNQNTGTQTVQNETVTADVGNFTDLEGYQIVKDSETVYGYNDSSGSFEKATEGTDYEMDYDGGKIKALNGSTLIDDGEDVKVTYDWKATDGTTTLVITLIPLFMALLAMGVLASKVQDMM